MPELQRKGKRVGLHSAVFPKVGLQTQVLPTACTGKSLANCESQVSRLPTLGAEDGVGGAGQQSVNIASTFRRRVILLQKIRNARVCVNLVFDFGEAMSFIRSEERR